LFLAFLIQSAMPVYCQKSKEFSFQINAGTTSSTSLEAFKKEFEVLIAYSPSLQQFVSPQSKVIKADNIDELFSKLCYSLQLDFIVSSAKSYLVRSDAEEIKQATEIILHIKLEDESNHPISYAAVYDKSGRYFGFTDNKGDCFIKIPKAKKGESLRVHSLGHQDKELIIDTDQSYQAVQLHAEPIKAMPVMINSIKQKLNFARNQSITSQKETIEKLLVSSVFQKDVIRALQLMPGISAINDSKASIRIRGANEEATLLVLDGMPVYRADHFFGIFGAFNSSYIRDIALFKNNIPVEYGGRTSGLLKIESPSGIEPFNAKLDLNLINSGISLNLPVSKQIALLFSGRKTYTNLLNTGYYDLSQRENIGSDPRSKPLLSQITSNPLFNFYDINSKFIFKSGNHHFDMNLFNSKDKFQDSYDISFRGRNFEINNELFNQQSKWANLVYGANYRYQSPVHIVSASIYKSEHNTAYDITSSLVRKEKTGIIKDTLKIYNYNDIKDLGFKVRYQNKNLNNLMFGAEYVAHDNNLFIENDRNPLFEIARKGSESNLFSSITFGDKSKKYAEPAVRFMFINNLKKAYVLPQIYLSSALSDGLLIKFSATRQVQNVRMLEHENALGQKQQFFTLSNNTNVPVGVGFNYMAGFWKNHGDFTVDVEAYFRKLDGAIIHATQNPGLRSNSSPAISGYRLFSGGASTTGVDFSLLYERKGYFSLLAYTISKAQNKFPELFGNQSFPSAEDSRHQVKWVNTYAFRKLDFSIAYIGASGRPYLDLSSITTSLDRSSLVVSNYIKNLPDYHRFDVGVVYKMHVLGTDIGLGASVFNLFDRVNVKYRQFVYQLPPQPGGQNVFNTILGSDVAQLERTFNLTLSLSFQKQPKN
jgi:hypothetical protein